jgi:uncharacterized protein YcbX
MSTRTVGAALDAPVQGVAVARVSALHVYPVKALAGVALDAARVDDLGLTPDRRWMLVDADGRALTQREVPALVRLATALLGDGGVRVTAPDGSARELHAAPPDAPRRLVRLFGDVIEAAASDAATDAWLARHVGVPCALVHLPGDVVRPVDPDYAEPDDRAAFSTATPCWWRARRRSPISTRASRHAARRRCRWRASARTWCSPATGSPRSPRTPGARCASAPATTP